MNASYRLFNCFTNAESVAKTGKAWSDVNSQLTILYGYWLRKDSWQKLDGSSLKCTLTQNNWGDLNAFFHEIFLFNYWKIQVRVKSCVYFWTILVKKYLNPKMKKFVLVRVHKNSSRNDKSRLIIRQGRHPKRKESVFRAAVFWKKIVRCTQNKLASQLTQHFNFLFSSISSYKLKYESCDLFLKYFSFII